MKFQTTRTELLDAILFSSKAINPRISSFILNGVLLDVDIDLNIFSTDLETSIKSTIKVKIEEKGKAVVPAKILINILKSLNESKITLQFNKETNQVLLSCEKAHFTLNTLSLEEYPAFPETSIINPIKLQLDKFKTLVSKVQRAVSQDESRVILTGILMEIKKKPAYHGRNR